MEQAAVKKSFREKLKERELLSPWFLAFLGSFVFGILVYVLARIFPAFAEFWARYPSQGIRFVLGKVTSILPFSTAEWVIFSSPVLIAGYFFFSARSMKKNKSVRNYYRWMLSLVCILLTIVTLFFTAFGPCYFRYGLDHNLGIAKRPVSAQELYDTAKIVSDEIKKFKDDLQFDIHGACIMPYDYDTLVEKVNEAYGKYAATADHVGHFDTYAKPMAISPLFTYTHISGIYTFMTGEVNININYPDFIRPFTIAHEFSHQRGIAREDEANFAAYLVCIESEDAFVRYSGYSNLLQYLTDALYKADRDLYSKFRSREMPDVVSKEFSAYSAFFDKYRESTASKVTGTVNNTFLGSQGQSAGTKSYGLVVDLAVAYYLPAETE